MTRRLAFYASRLIASQMTKGIKYHEIKKVVCIAILDYEMIKDSDRYHNRYRLYDPDSCSLFSDVIEIHTLELPKLPKDGGDALYNWLRFLNANRKEEFEMIATKSPEIKKAYGVLKQLSDDERTRMQYEARQMAEWDAQARIDYMCDEAMEKGMEKGIEKGILAGKQDIARKMLARGIEPDVVADLSGLSVDEVESLRD